MGRRKIGVLKYIKDDKLRDLTYSKRKRGILKKLIEL